MASDKRFFIYKLGEVIQLNGVISDTTPFHIINEMLGPKNTFDCSRIISASWNGLLLFDKYLTSVPGKITLTRIPYHLYQYLRLLPSIGQRYDLAEVELPLCSTEGVGGRRRTDSYFSVDDLAHLAFQTQSPFLSVADRAFLQGRAQFLVPALFHQRNEASLETLSPWYKQHLDEFDFWFDYASFATSTLTLALDLVICLESAFEDTLLDFEHNVIATNRALQELGQKTPEHYSTTIINAYLSVRSCCTHVAIVLQQAAESSQKVLNHMQLMAADSGSLLQDKTFYHLVHDFADVMLEVEHSVPQIEDIGVAIGHHLIQLSRIGEIRAMLQSLSPDAVSSEAIARIREHMMIMDPLSEDDWEETCREFCANLEHIEEKAGKAVILLQGFDLLRQILEHRIQEGRPIKDFCEQGSHDNWRDIKQQVLGLIRKTLVTDQEKYSCEFFIPEAARVEETAQKPGDVLLF